LTAEQLEASRAERMRLNGQGALTLEDARTWLEETGLCLFLPRRQFSSFIAPSFVEAVAGERNPAPGAKIVALAENLLVRLEADGVAVRLNLLGTPGEQPDYIVAGWVLPYIYALRGDRDWRRSPQLTGSRAVSQLAIQTYKLLEAGDAAIPQLKHALGREVTESAVLRAITELWQQLRIIPVVSAPGRTPQWQLLRLRFQKAIAEGASTSQVTAISVLASIYLQAVIAASMEEVEMFLAPLTARSKIREVLRGLAATRQVHTIALGHAPHFYVAGTLPEFAAPPTVYASAAMPASSRFLHSYEHEEEAHAPAMPAPVPANAPAAARTSSGSRRVSAVRWAHGAAKNAHGKHNGRHAAKGSASGVRFSGNGGARASRTANGASGMRNTKPSQGRSLRNGHVGAGKAAAKLASRRTSPPRKDARSNARTARASRKRTLTAAAKAGNRTRYGFTAPPRQKTKKRG
jgi:hypothetical protein